MGAGGEDVQLSAAARARVPFQIECKNKQDNSSIYKKYDQAVEHGTHSPLLVVKMNHREPLVVLDAVLFFKILRGYIGNL